MKSAGERRVASFLVRFWLEPRETEDGIPQVRGYIKHLQTGEERYVSDTGLILEYVLRRLRNGHGSQKEDWPENNSDGDRVDAVLGERTAHE